MSELIDVPGAGKLSIASNNDGTAKSARLLVVFGGIAVSKTEFDGVPRKKAIFVPSGDYMWNFMDDLKDRFHVFVSSTNDVPGKGSYDALLKKLKDKGVTPPSDQILYLFSGGGSPGTQLLDGNGADVSSAESCVIVVRVGLVEGWRTTVPG